MLDDSPLNCKLPCTKVSYKVERTEFPGFNRSNIANQVSMISFGVASTDTEVHEDYILVIWFDKNVFNKDEIVEWEEKPFAWPWPCIVQWIPWRGLDNPPTEQKNVHVRLIKKIGFEAHKN